MTVTYQTREARIGLLFLSPWIIGFVLLKALPILAAFVMVVPIIVLFLSRRFFMEDMIVTQIEK